VGGYGSGRWGYGGKADAKGLVEDCRTLDINEFVREGIVRPGARFLGVWSWRSPEGEVRAPIGLDARTGDEAGTLRLIHGVRRAAEQAERLCDYTIRLVTTVLPSGGRRWWFTCPAKGSGGSACGRRSVKLYLPPVGRIFACRRCHELTYRSCRESRKRDGQWRRLAAATGRDPRQVKRLMERRRRGIW
jgi:hypothetical protein